MFIAGLAVAIALLWSRVHLGQTVNGLGEGVRALVNSPQAGLLLELKVRPYQLVNQGDVLAVIRPADPRAPLEMLRLELELARFRFQPNVAEQNAMNYERVRADLLRTKAELAVAKVNLERAQNEVQRNTPLYRERLVSEDLYDLSLKTREAFQAEVTEKTKAVQDMEERMEALRPLGDPQTGLAAAPLEALLGRLDAAQASAASNYGPLTLVAPFSGMATAVLRQQGEYVLDGEPLVAVDSLWSDRVIGYLRQPYPVEAQIGLPVKVTTRTHQRTQFWSTISQVGAQVEVITNALAFVRQGSLVDVGLPIVIDLPPQSRVRPGEIVDLWIKPTEARFTVEVPPRSLPASQPN
jgi:multidrug resistance efflux pump